MKIFTLGKALFSLGLNNVSGETKTSMYFFTINRAALTCPLTWRCKGCLGIAAKQSEKAQGK